MEIMLTVVFGLLGTAIGSFLNVSIDRLPRGKSLLYPPSHCEACQHPLSPRDLIPVFSYLWLRGHCRYCNAPVQRRLLWVEIGSGFLFAFTYWYYGLSVEFAITIFYCCLFIVIMVIDLEHGLILDKIVYPAAVVALIISVFLPQSEIFFLPWSASLSGIIGGAIGFVYLLIPFLIALLIYKGGGMGQGDVKLAALIGLATGFPLVLVALITASILGGLVGAILLLLKVMKRKDPLPFGSFLSLATIATLIWGSDILNWYLGLSYI
jgi:leader peptidase (prepilin peptidase)/N-methyltransferase